ncbi:MAG: hypothetical protein JXR46_10325 [Calditrichaceae bacterium]|nr:hypothetical protein [Calditrichaceae bacterium]
MSLTRTAISENYQQALKLAVKLMKDAIRRRSGYEADINDQNEIVLSAVSDVEVVGLLTSMAFDKESYLPAISEALNRAGKELFFDRHKKRFTTLEKVENFISAQEKPAIDDADRGAIKFGQILPHLSKSNAQYWKNVLIKQYPEWQNISIPKEHNPERWFIDLNNRLFKMRLCYPEGGIMDTSKLDGMDDLNESQVLAGYKNIWCGIEKRYPPNFLQKDAPQRSAIITRYLVDGILQQNPEELLENLEEVFFIEHKLQNVYRYFNYSANRAFRNAYPEIIMPWQKSRIDSFYWREADNRISAVQWLVEEKLNISPAGLRKAKIHRRDFARYGLSYLFNRYYNSVGKALQEAYPAYQPWQLGIVSVNYWNDENAAIAVKSMIESKGWAVDSLPDRVYKKELNRRTFGEFGLAALFEKKFGKNIFNAIDAAYPGRFRPWELGNVPKGFWQKHSSLLSVLRWIAGRENIQDKGLSDLIKRDVLTKQCIKKYAIGRILLNRLKGRLHTIFNPVYALNFHRNKTVKRLENFIKKERQMRSWRLILLYGISYPMVCRVSIEDEQRYSRMLKRMKRLEDRR